MRRLESGQFWGRKGAKWGSPTLFAERREGRIFVRMSAVADRRTELALGGDSENCPARTSAHTLDTE